MVLSPDGKNLAAGGNFKEVCLWDVATLKARDPLKGHTDEVLALAFSPDSKTLATSGKDRTVRFWPVSAVNPRGQNLFRSRRIAESG